MAQRARMYNAWANMKARCDNPNNNHYQWYGGKGIGYIPKWASYKGFCEDMQDTYSDPLTLDRKDGNKDYSPENCRWVTAKEQQNNRSDTRKFTINGVTKTFLEWRETSSVKPSTIRQRFYVYRWDLIRCLETPARKRG